MSVQWFSQDPHNSEWIAYNKEMSDAIESQYQKWGLSKHRDVELAVLSFAINGQPYKIDFTLMQQVNPMGYTRQVERRGPKSSSSATNTPPPQPGQSTPGDLPSQQPKQQSEVSTTKVRWQSQDPHTHEWLDYPAEVSDGMEQKYQAGEEEVHLKIGGRIFTVDFATNEQVNELGYARNIRRVGGGRKAETVSAPQQSSEPKEVQDSVGQSNTATTVTSAPQTTSATSTSTSTTTTGSGGKWQSQDPHNNDWLDYSSTHQKQLEDAYQAFKANGAKSFIQIVLGTGFFTIDFNTMQQLNQLGFGRQIRRKDNTADLTKKVAVPTTSKSDTRMWATIEGDFVEFDTSSAAMKQACVSVGATHQFDMDDACALMFSPKSQSAFHAPRGICNAIVVGARKLESGEYQLWVQLDSEEGARPLQPEDHISKAFNAGGMGGMYGGMGGIGGMGGHQPMGGMGGHQPMGGMGGHQPFGRNPRAMGGGGDDIHDLLGGDLGSGGGRFQMPQRHGGLGGGGRPLGGTMPQGGGGLVNRPNQAETTKKEEPTKSATEEKLLLDAEKVKEFAKQEMERKQSQELEVAQHHGGEEAEFYFDDDAPGGEDYSDEEEEKK